MARLEIGFFPWSEKSRRSREERQSSGLAKKRSEEKGIVYCPQWGLQMANKSYSYLLPIYKCFNCSLIWFETDELEILQFLIEKQFFLKKIDHRKIIKEKENL